MSLKSTIENHPVIIFGTAMAIGFGAFPGFLAVTDRTIISKTQLADLNKQRADPVDITDSLMLSPHLTRDKASAAKLFEMAIENTTWSVECGKNGAFQFGFGHSGVIVGLDLWSDYTWAVTAPRSVTMTSNDGWRVYYMFSEDYKSFSYISWQQEICNGRRVM